MALLKARLRATVYSGFIKAENAQKALKLSVVMHLIINVLGTKIQYIDDIASTEREHSNILINTGWFMALYIVKYQRN